MPTLDTSLHQVLIDFYDDANGFHWHHRVLGVPLGGSIWIGGTPDKSIQRIDLSNHRVIILHRDSEFPAARRAATYAWDSNDWDDAYEATFMRECRSMASVHGRTPAVGGHSDTKRGNNSNQQKEEKE